MDLENQHCIMGSKRIKAFSDVLDHSSGWLFFFVVTVCVCEQEGERERERERDDRKWSFGFWSSMRAYYAFLTSTTMDRERDE